MRMHMNIRMHSAGRNTGKGSNGNPITPPFTANMLVITNMIAKAGQNCRQRQGWWSHPSLSAIRLLPRQLFAKAGNAAVGLWALGSGLLLVMACVVMAT